MKRRKNPEIPQIVLYNEMSDNNVYAWTPIEFSDSAKQSQEFIRDLAPGSIGDMAAVIYAEHASNIIPHLMYFSIYTLGGWRAVPSVYGEETVAQWNMLSFFEYPEIRADALWLRFGYLTGDELLDAAYSLCGIFQEIEIPPQVGYALDECMKCQRGLIHTSEIVKIQKELARQRDRVPYGTPNTWTRTAFETAENLCALTLSPTHVRMGTVIENLSNLTSFLHEARTGKWFNSSVGQVEIGRKLKPHINFQLAVLNRLGF